ncbi:DUF7681 family protein [Azospirillum sp.]|uniref:Acb2/Tad1 domain-containing protein n=1 Tax=Azospirillum sp. TaxID=34012 RepID=UPI003D71C9C7
MAHVYEGAPDDRQAGDIKPSRFRPKYRALTDAEKALHDAIKGKAAELEALFERARDLRIPAVEIQPVNVGDGAESIMVEGVSVGPEWEYFHDGMKSLELAVMWTVKGLTA